MKVGAGVSSLCLALVLLFFFLSPVNGDDFKDAPALLALKTEIDPSDALPWRRDDGAAVCSWVGVRKCSPDGRVTKLVLEFFNLTGQLLGETLSSFDQLRVLSFKSNFLYGEIPDLSAITNLKALYLSNNRFSGRIPLSLSTLHRLKVLVLSGNLITGEIPHSLTGLPKLHALLLQDNLLTGKIPTFEQPNLRFFNVSVNHLSGEIPQTTPLKKFNSSSFTGNPNLCGGPLQKFCAGDRNREFPPTSSPVASVTVSSTSYSSQEREQTLKKKRVVAIVAGSVGAFLFLAIFTGLVAAFFLVPWRKTAAAEAGEGNEGAREGGEVLSLEKGKLGDLVFCGGVGEMYSLEELLKASAETLGRGTVGCTYKAVMESGFIVTVKRLKDSNRPGYEEFRRRIETIGRLRHPNLVNLRAYFLAEEERLLVFDYFPNGSLYSLIHGSRTTGGGKPLHWTSCLKIAEDVATGLLFLHQNNVSHGNLKSSNVLLGPDFESCLTDYGLVPYFCPTSEDLVHALRRTELDCTSDVYSFGILLLELLAGKTPPQDLVQEHVESIPDWVKSLREHEIESGDDPASRNSNSEKLGALLNVAVACITLAPEGRPTAKEVVIMIRDARVEVIVSENSSDRSPGRWSDTVQSMPREHGSDHLSFAERD